MMTELDKLKELTICSIDELRDGEIRIHRIHRNHHSREDSDGVSRHRLVPTSPTFYMSRFQMITGFRLRLNWNLLLKCVNGAAIDTCAEMNSNCQPPCCLKNGSDVILPLWKKHLALICQFREESCNCREWIFLIGKIKAWKIICKVCMSVCLHVCPSVCQLVLLNAHLFVRWLYFAHSHTFTAITNSNDSRWME